MSHARPPLATLADELRAVTVRLFAYLCGIAGLAIMAAEVFSPPPAAVPAAPVVRPAWIAVEKPWPAFEISLPEIDAEPHYAIRRHPLGGGRKDILTFGEPGRSLRFAAIEIYRPGSELMHFADPADAIGPLVAPLKPAGDLRVSLPLETKYGLFATIDIAVGRFGSGHCVGFVRHDNAPRLQISGVSCSMDTIVNRDNVACLLDRLTLLSAGGDAEVAELFAHAEINRTFCGQRNHLMYATPKRPMPSEHSAVRLRGTLASR